MKRAKLTETAKAAVLIDKIAARCVQRIEADMHDRGMLDMPKDCKEEILWSWTNVIVAEIKRVAR